MSTLILKCTCLPFQMSYIHTFISFFLLNFILISLSFKKIYTFSLFSRLVIFLYYPNCPNIFRLFCCYIFILMSLSLKQIYIFFSLYLRRIVSPSITRTFCISRCYCFFSLAHVFVICLCFVSLCYCFFSIAQFYLRFFFAK